MDWIKTSRKAVKCGDCRAAGLYRPAAFYRTGKVAPYDKKTPEDYTAAVRYVAEMTRPGGESPMRDSFLYLFRKGK